MSNERKTILWLVSWYPNKYDWFDGDFIQRHAKAAALYDNVHVLFIKQLADHGNEEVVLNRENGLTEQIIYLPKQEGPFDKLRSLQRWWQVSRSAAEEVIRDKRPVMVHVHVPWKAGLLALWIKKKFSIPYIVTEHWGIYNSVAEDNIHTRSFFFRRLLKNVYEKAKSFTSVSRYLAEGVNQTMVKRDYTVVPNVVDTGLFFPAGEKAEHFTFLHVSNMVPLKNVDGILAAFAQFLAQTKASARLVLIGNRNQQYVQLAQKMNLLNTTVFFRGEVPYSEVASEMQKAHVLVLNSDIENSPCVVGEALCCGLPVIATAVGGIPELVSATNSLLVPPRDVSTLAKAFGKMFSSYAAYPSDQIALAAQQKFSYPEVGQQLHNLYQ